MNSIKVDIDFQSAEFQMHACQLHFAPKSVLKGLGPHQADNLHLFISNNECNIFPKDALAALQDDFQSMPQKGASHEVEKTVEIDPIDSGTIQINKTVESSVKDSTVVHIDSSLKGEPVKKTKKDTDLENSSVNNGSVKPLFFFTPKKKHSIGKFGTFRTTLFRGDTSLKIKEIDITTIEEEPQAQPN